MMEGADNPVCQVHTPPVVSTKGERRTRWVVVLTAGMMVAELTVGMWTRSLALTADGWHMMTHVGALGLAALAYWYARTRAGEQRFAFGTGKVYALAGYSSAALLLIVAVSMIVQAIDRFMNPVEVGFAEAFPVAVLGLLVNLASAKLLDVGHDHAPAHDHAHDAHHEHHEHHEQHEHAAHGQGHDHNLKAAYLHVVADALTSVAAIAALLAGRYFKLGWFDPVVAIVGALVILKWGVGLMQESARQLVDLDPSTAMRDKVRGALEGLGDTRVEDLHLWRVGPGAMVCVVSISSAAPRGLDEYKGVVTAAVPVNHLTVEICRRAVGAAS